MSTIDRTGVSSTAFILLIANTDSNQRIRSSQGIVATSFVHEIVSEAIIAVVVFMVNYAGSEVAEFVTRRKMASPVWMRKVHRIVDAAYVTEADGVAASSLE
jgi:hypothetical protein